MRCCIYMSADLIYVSSFDEAISIVKLYRNSVDQKALHLLKHKTYSDVYGQFIKPTDVLTGAIILESSPIFNCVFATRNPLSQIYISGNSSTKSGKALINSPYFGKMFTSGQDILRNLNNIKSYGTI